MLRLDRIEQRYGARRVLAGVSLDVAAGRCVALTGENGSGKSTLLRIAAGREEPSAGSALLNGAPVDEDDADRRAEIATVLDQAACYPDLTVHEHLMLVALAHGADDRARALVDSALEAHRLSGHTDALPDELSSGQRQLMALATVAVRPYRLLILDEPEQRLHGDARAELAARLRKARAHGCAILLATHDPELAEQTADATHTLYDGRLCSTSPGAATDGDGDGDGNRSRTDGGEADPAP
ncbi:ABC transporter ATP-binding protein [Streptomyces sp. P38-E01]|uniref:ABC transporter ATP-binding protein n=1 Tax=Streptomyces tardus TaxID=2780544 RepID=A0A949JDQ3_9ACTN|nr:ABC transporter ATP-binding protein [Streptomyces tardus]MBU7596655.1 ABC transporter ATP-binding protein [Streptomyces tardus]